MEFFGLIFIISTTLILLLKKETNSNYYQVNDNLSIRHTFESLWKIIQLKSIQKLLLILFTCKVRLIFCLIKENLNKIFKNQLIDCIWYSGNKNTQAN